MEKARHPDSDSQKDGHQPGESWDERQRSPGRPQWRMAPCPPRPIGICELPMTSTQPGKCISTLWCMATSPLAALQESKDWENLLPQCRKTWSNSGPCRAQSFHQTMCMICWPASHCHCRIHPLRVCPCWRTAGRTGTFGKN